MRKVLLVGVILFTLLLPGHSGNAGAYSLAQAGGVQRDITYCTANGVALKMDIYPPSTAPGRLVPVVLYVHGGSWISGDKWEIGLAAGELNAKGYLVASVNYRLAPQHKWPAQIEDVKCAVRHLRANVSAYNLDPNRIAAWGSSAGGHLVSLLGLTNKSAGFDGTGGYPEQSSSVQAVIDMFGPTDLTAFDPDDFAVGIGESVFGVKPGGPTEVLVKASPVNYVSAGAPPFLILQGDKDRIVPASQSQMLYDKLVAAGAPATLVMVKNADHGFAPSGGPISPTLGELRTIIHDFLDRNIGGSQTQSTSRTFSETGKTVRGKFLRYWETHGGLAQQGFPISDEMQEKSDIDGKTYTVQYFERAVFELHPENQPPYDVLLSLLGVFEYKRYYTLVGPANEHANEDNPLLFGQTGKTIGGRFRAYWEQNGGLAQQGYPITDEFEEKSRLDGKTYTVQYFERAVFELHPENQPPFDVLLSQIGTFRAHYKAYRPGPGDCSLLYTLRGEVVGQGTNTTPVGYGMKSYQLEEVVLPGPITCQVYVPSPAGGYHTPTLTFDKFWRLTLNADRTFPVGEARWDIFLNGTLAGRGIPTGKHEITALVYDSARVLEGATIGISYGDPTNPQHTLPEKLQFNRSP